MTGKKAIVIGATGLVGYELVKLLLKNNDFEKITVFARRLMDIQNPKLEQHIINFAAPDEWQHLVVADVLFSAMGTTLKKAKSKANQYQIDFTYPYNFAKIAAANGVKQYVLVSASGANAKSLFFYMRMKGELDEAVLRLPFARIAIIRPALLYGNRTEKRAGEKLGLGVTKTLNKIGLMRSYRPIHAQTVAKAMIEALKVNTPYGIYAKNQLFDLAKSYKD